MIPRYILVIAAFLLVGSSQQKSSFTIGGAPLDLSNIRPKSDALLNPHFPTPTEINNMYNTQQQQQQQQPQQQQYQQPQYQQQPAQQQPGQAQNAAPQVTQEQIQMMVLRKTVEDQTRQLQAAQQQTQYATQQMEMFKLENARLKQELQLVNGQSAQLQLQLNTDQTTIQQLEHNLQEAQKQVEQAWEGSRRLEAYNNQLLGQNQQLQDNKVSLELEIERLREMEMVERDLRLQQQAQIEKEKKGSQPVVPVTSPDAIGEIYRRLEQLKNELAQTKVNVTSSTPEPKVNVKPRQLEEIEQDLADLYKRYHLGNSTRTTRRRSRLQSRFNLINYL